MKLLYCPRCGDMIRLQKYVRRCECGESWGIYYSTADAILGGLAVPIGVDNDSLAKAVANRPEGFRGKVKNLYAFVYGYRASGAMNVDTISNDRSRLMNAAKGRTSKPKPKKKAAKRRISKPRPKKKTAKGTAKKE